MNTETEKIILANSEYLMRGKLAVVGEVQRLIGKRVAEMRCALSIPSGDGDFDREMNRRIYGMLADTKR